MSEKADIGLIGLAVMGENLVMNMADNGFSVSVFNRTPSRVTRFVEGRAKGRSIQGFFSLPDLVESLATPRKVMLMVKAGDPVDQLIDQLIPLLSSGDIVIDGGNSHFPDTIRRTRHLESLGLLYVGTGVSGGEEGALKGPSIMPGGSAAAWPAIMPIFQAIAAKVDEIPCCDWIGPDGSGHYVKMVHNGIEYGDMQIICEAYHVMKNLLGMSNTDMAAVFDDWNHGVLDSYLVEITRDILRTREPDGTAVVDLILDAAGQKGTGKWTSVAALDAGVPATLISEAVFARFLSAAKEERTAASAILRGPTPEFAGDRNAFLTDLRDALYVSKIISYAQGFALLKAADEKYGWSLDFGKIAQMWRGGCIIRSVFLNDIKNAFDRDNRLSNLLLDPYFHEQSQQAQAGWRRVVSACVLAGIPVPAFSSALAYYDGYRSDRLPANLLQAQRDFFGAHTYERVDKPRGVYHHTNWTGQGGDTTSNSYEA